MKLERSTKPHCGHTFLFLAHNLASMWVSLFHWGNACTSAKAKYFMGGEVSLTIWINSLNEKISSSAQCFLVQYSFTNLTAERESAFCWHALFRKKTQKKTQTKKKDESVITNRFSAGRKEIVNTLSILLVNYSNFTNPLTFEIQLTIEFFIKS